MKDKTALITGEAIKQGIPLGCFAMANEVEEVVCFVTSDHASSVTGPLCKVDGGMQAD